MLARVTTFTIDGLEPVPVTVEADLRAGLPSFTVVGLADRAVSEARDRVRAALLNSGFEFPLRRLTVNLAPAHLRKEGPGFDLSIACAILAASGQIPAEPFTRLAVFGELSLGGEVRACRGVLAAAEGTRAAGLAGLVVARSRVAEAALVGGLDALGIERLPQLGAALRGEVEATAAPTPAGCSPDGGPDLGDVRGQAAAIRALTVAAAGGHNLLFRGPPGTGKTMLARRLPGILPPLEPDEALEVTRIQSVVGLHGGDGLVRRRPFRAPHHTISAAGLVGGGRVPMPGEATLAHRGVLFLDELSEFDRRALEALRQPLEDGTVAVVRGQRVARFPTRFALVAATNPCPCGRGRTACRCAEVERARYERRLSGPLLDRIDLVVDVPRPTAEELAAGPVTTSEAARALVLGARERRRERGPDANARPRARAPRDGAGLPGAAVALLARVYASGAISARGRDRAIRVARTIADLDGSHEVLETHVLEALGYRHDRDRLSGTGREAA